jgi:N-acetylneuraminic acid mutarotase
VRVAQTPLARVRWQRRRARHALSAALGAVLAAAPGALASGHWHRTADLHQARYLATATLMFDGNVLVAGGFSSAPLASAELYDPTSGHWTSAPAMYSPRFAQTSTLLPDGSVLVAGGANLTVGYLSSALRYKPTTNTWAPVAPMPQPRANATATLLFDGRVLVAGGLRQGVAAMSSTVLYDPKTNTWAAAPSLATARYHHTATLLPDGDVLVVGGEQDHHGVLQLLPSAELYVPRLNRWRSAGHLPYPLANQSATLLANGRVLVVGGGDRAPGFTARAAIYDPKRNRWSAAASLPARRAFQVAVCLRDGRVLVSGGINDQGGISDSELYDPKRDRWRSAGRTVAALRESALLLADGDALVVGGQRYQGTPVATASVYTP